MKGKQAEKRLEKRAEAESDPTPTVDVVEDGRNSIWGETGMLGTLSLGTLGASSLGTLETSSLGTGWVRHQTETRDTAGVIGWESSGLHVGQDRKVVDWRFEIWKSAGFGEGEFGVGANPPEKIPWS